MRKIKELLQDDRIHSVCESAKCPNIGECFSRNTMTFMILGDVCTRNCLFCGIESGLPQQIDLNEPQRVAKAVKKLRLDYVVVTSVTRDDLTDGGASQFAKVIKAIKSINPISKVEVLIPDFKGSEAALKVVLDAHPYVLNHNIETIPRLYSKIRPQADYQQSLTLLINAKNARPVPSWYRVYTKSGFMVGLGESRAEIIALLEDLKKAGCDIVTIGQYLPPSKNSAQVKRYVQPEEFEEYQTIGKNLGFLKVFSGPFVRSSYHAEEIIKCRKQND
ncbi:MAG: lipoyl synthase [Candidatus Margulisbacteria bacterium]|nr:lipoyl synthase [Candidatus Margulisiibacteriota bacterium]